MAASPGLKRATSTADAGALMISHSSTAALNARTLMGSMSGHPPASAAPSAMGLLSAPAASHHDLMASIAGIPQGAGAGGMMSSVSGGGPRRLGLAVSLSTPPQGGTGGTIDPIERRLASSLNASDGEVLRGFKANFFRRSDVEGFITAEQLVEMLQAMGTQCTLDQVVGSIMCPEDHIDIDSALAAYRVLDQSAAASLGADADGLITEDLQLNEVRKVGLIKYIRLHLPFCAEEKQEGVRYVLRIDWSTIELSPKRKLMLVAALVTIVVCAAIIGTMRALWEDHTLQSASGLAVQGHAVMMSGVEGFQSAISQNTLLSMRQNADRFSTVLSLIMESREAQLVSRVTMWNNGAALATFPSAALGLDRRRLALRTIGRMLTVATSLDALTSDRLSASPFFSTNASIAFSLASLPTCNSSQFVFWPPNDGDKAALSAADAAVSEQLQILRRASSRASPEPALLETFAASPRWERLPPFLNGSSTRRLRGTTERGTGADTVTTDDVFAVTVPAAGNASSCWQLRVAINLTFPPVRAALRVMTLIQARAAEKARWALAYVTKTGSAIPADVVHTGTAFAFRSSLSSSSSSNATSSSSATDELHVYWTSPAALGVDCTTRGATGQQFIDTTYTTTAPPYSKSAPVEVTSSLLCSSYVDVLYATALQSGLTSGPAAAAQLATADVVLRGAQSQVAQAVRVLAMVTPTWTPGTAYFTATETSAEESSDVASSAFQGGFSLSLAAQQPTGFMITSIAIKRQWLVDYLRSVAVGEVDFLNFGFTWTTEFVLGWRNETTGEFVPQRTAYRFQPECLGPCKRVETFSSGARKAIDTRSSGAQVQPDYRPQPCLSSYAFSEAYETTLVIERDVVDVNRYAIASIRRILAAYAARQLVSDVFLVWAPGAPETRQYDPNAECSDALLCDVRGTYGIVTLANCLHCARRNASSTSNIVVQSSFDYARQVGLIDDHERGYGVFLGSSVESSLLSQDADLADAGLKWVQSVFSTDLLRSWSDVSLRTVPTSQLSDGRVMLLHRLALNISLGVVLVYSISGENAGARTTADVSALLAFVVGAACALSLLVIVSLLLRGVQREWVRVKRRIEDEREAFHRSTVDVVPAPLYFKVVPHPFHSSESLFCSISVLDFVGAHDRFEWEMGAVAKLSAYLIAMVDTVCAYFRVHRLRTFGDKSLIVGGWDADDESARHPVRNMAACVALQALTFDCYAHYPGRVEHILNAFGSVACNQATPGVVGLKEYVGCAVIPELRVGFHVGDCVMALFPCVSSPHVHCDVFGPAVATASRLQTVARPSSILASVQAKTCLKMNGANRIFRFDNKESTVVRGRSSLAASYVTQGRVPVPQSILQALGIKYARRMHRGPYLAASESSSVSTSVCAQSHSEVTTDSGTSGSLTGGRWGLRGTPTTSVVAGPAPIGSKPTMMGSMTNLTKSTSSASGLRGGGASTSDKPTKDGEGAPLSTSTSSRDASDRRKKSQGGDAK